MDPGQEPGWPYWEVQGAGGARATGEGIRELGSRAGRLPLAVPAGPGPVWTGVWVRFPRAGLCGVLQAGVPPPPNPALSGPAGSCAARREGPPGLEPRAPRPAPRPGPYITDFEFPDRGTR